MITFTVRPGTPPLVWRGTYTKGRSLCHVCLHALSRWWRNMYWTGTQWSMTCGECGATNNIGFHGDRPIDDERARTQAEILP